MADELFLVRVSDIRSESAALAVGKFMAYRGFCPWQTEQEDNWFMGPSSYSAEELKKSLEDEIQKMYQLELVMTVVPFAN